jgi:cytochrome P450
MGLDLALVAQRVRAEGRVFPLIGPALGIFDPGLSLRLDRANFDRLEMAPRFADAARGRPDRCPVRWKDVRSAIGERTRGFGTPATHRRVHQAMLRTLEAAEGSKADLTWLAERAISETLIPYIIDGLPPRAHRAVLRDQHTKLRNVLTPFERRLEGLERRLPALRKLRDARDQIMAARAVRRELGARLAGKRPAREDYAQTVLGLVDRLGVERATYVVTTLLTAVAGAPGTLAACMWYELVRRPEWRDRIRAEFDGVDDEALFRDPVRSAPAAHRFVKETMRMWSFPLILQRVVSRDFEVDGLAFHRGQTYFLSSYLLHRDPDYWDDPERFDPDRWLRPERPQVPGTYIPFGWAPRTCPGASFGLAQILLFLQIVAARFDVEPISPERAWIELDGIAAPQAFHGIVRSRAR